MGLRLNRERLVDAALVLVDEEGAEALSMRTLAARVDRQVSSLYNHVSGRTELIELMRARIVADIDVTAFGSAEEPESSAQTADKGWDAALEEWAGSYLRAFATHPNLIRLLATTPIRHHSAYAMYDAVVAGLVRAGWPESLVFAVVRTVEAHVLGSALDIVAPGDLLVQGAVDAGLPAVREALAERHASTYAAEAAFSLGLRALIDGLRLRLAEVAG